MSGTLDIFKASAGSGKTHKLTHKYISFLLGDKAKDDAYKHILAVTFTNKATEEMKSRIVKALYKLSEGEGEECEKKSEDEIAVIKKQARNALTAILHDYSNFQVCTIDKFFQQIFRSFARELGSFSNYRVELSNDDVLSHVVDELLSGLDDPCVGNQVFDIINKFAEDQLRYKSKHSFQKRMLEFAKLFLKEDFKVKSADYESDLGKMKDVEQRAQDYVKDYIETLKELGSEALKAIDEQGLKPEDFKGGNSSAMKKLHEWEKGTINKLLTESQKSMFLGGPEEWFTKSSKDAKAKIALGREACNRVGEPGLDTLLADIVALLDKYPQYCTAVIIRNNVGVMKIFGRIYDTLHKYLQDNNIMLLGETTQAIGKMIGSSDTPFIYERVGTWIDHYLLDEFQDFSLMQWDNFKPLLEESLSKDNGNLIVGDVKQCIYRWRGSDWNTLESGVAKDIGEERIAADTLLVNRRSDKAIVEFNNYLFKNLTDPANRYFDGDTTIGRAYNDCEQKTHSEGAGHVKVTFYEKPKAGDPNPALAALKGEIEALDKLGYPRSSVYVLVRKNKEAAKVAEQLISDGIEVITDESLLVGASAYVQRIVAVLKYMAKLDDATNLQVMKEMGIDVSKVNVQGNSLYDICENIVRSLDQSLIGGEMPYLMTFMDLVIDYMRDYGSDMAGFLSWWDDVGSSQAVSAPASANAVRIMTIHKAKGLSCPAVIVPFFYEALTPAGNMPNYMWCKDTSLGAGLLPVEFGSAAKDSTFSPDYNREALLYKMDALNTAYVAFTRPRQELIVFAQKDNHTKGVSDKVYDLLSKQGKLINDVYETGSRLEYRPDNDEDKVIAPMTLSGYNSIPMEGKGKKARLELVYRGSDFFDPAGRDAARQRGIVLHDILSRINTATDIPAAVAAAVETGELPAAERAVTEAKIAEMLTSVAGYGWFREGQRVINELSIIDTDGNVHRPDRVVVDGDRVTVVDYKFGLPHNAHKTQVRCYMDMLSRMGYDKVDGYLWYASEGKIEKVD